MHHHFLFPTQYCICVTTDHENYIYVICMASDDTDVLVLQVYWVHRAALQCKVPMEQWNWTVLDINATCTELWHKCLPLLVHALSECDTTSYLYSKGKTRASHTLLSGNFPGLHSVIGEKVIPRVELMQAVNPLSLPSEVPGASMEIKRFNFFTKTKVRW